MHADGWFVLLSFCYWGCYLAAIALVISDNWQTHALLLLLLPMCLITTVVTCVRIGADDDDDNGLLSNDEYV